MRRFICCLLLICCLLVACTPAETDEPILSDNSQTSSSAKGGSVTCMSFNVLAYNTGEQKLELPETRAPYVAKLIREQNPDIVGIQEAVEYNGSRASYDWCGGLQEALGDIYDARTVLDEEDCYFGMMEITAGLMILYRKDRFQPEDSGCFEYTADGSRYFQWIKLKDVKYNTSLYVTNTHLSINNKGYEIGNANRTVEAEELLAFWESHADAPLFATGDYNCQSVEDPHLTLQRNGKFFPSCDISEGEETGSGLDFCYVNVDHQTVKDYKRLSKSYQIEDGQYMDISDHDPIMTYAEYK